MHKGDECALLSNAQPEKWKVLSPGGAEAVVPSVCFLIPPPNKEALDAVNRCVVRGTGLSPRGPVMRSAGGKGSREGTWRQSANTCGVAAETGEAAFLPAAASGTRSRGFELQQRQLRSEPGNGAAGETPGQGAPALEGPSMGWAGTGWAGSRRSDASALLWGFAGFWALLVAPWSWEGIISPSCCSKFQGF